MVLGFDAAGFLLRRLHVHREPVGREPPGNPRTHAQEIPGAAARRHRHHHLFGNHWPLEAFAGPIFLRLAGLVGCELAQGQLTQRRQVALPEEVRERLLDFRGIVDLPLPQSRAERLDRHVDVDDFVGALEHPVGNRLANAHAGRRGNRVVQRLDVLDVDRGDDIRGRRRAGRGRPRSVSGVAIRERWYGRARPPRPPAAAAP